MIQDKDLKTTNFRIDKISVSKNEKMEAGRFDTEININLTWKPIMLHKSGKEAIFKISCKLKSNVINLDMDSSLRVLFNREISNEDIVPLDSQKICVKEAVAYILQVIAEMSAKMGFSPIVLDRLLLDDIIKNVK